MTLPFRSTFVLPVMLLVLVSGCVSPNAPLIKRSAEPLSTTTPGTVGATPIDPGIGNGALPAQREPARISRGTGEVINQRAAAQPPPSFGGSGEATFNVEGESLHAVVKAILGDVLQQNYTIAPGVQGTVTFSTPHGVSPAQAFTLLEMVLGWNNARAVWNGAQWNIVPTDQAIAGNLSPRTGSAANARGYETRAVPLKYISATEMEKLLKPYARTGAVVQVDNSRNLIVVAGTRAELQNYLRTIEIFDVDWLAGMSVGVFPLQSAQASKVVTELDKVFGEGSKTPLAGMFRFMPLEGQNAVMVITPQARYLAEVQSWIERMDAGGDTPVLHVYEVKYVKAADLAEQLGNVYGNSSTTKTSAPSLMPGLEPVEVRTTDMPAADTPLPTARASGSTPSGDSSQTLTVGNGEVGISAVEESNSLLVRAAPAQWESIRRAIERLDTMPAQVHIEAQVVEVKLTGELSYGVSWFFGNQIDAATQATTNSLSHWVNSGTSIRPAPNGANFTFLGPSAQAILTTLDSVSDLRVLSAPSVLVRNNVEADFSSGTQIPVASTILNNNGNSNNDNTYSQVQFRQTGVSLKVKPRISSNGMVFMEITQDVSSPSASGPTIGGNISVDNRKLHTEVAVQTGETIVLAGLIKTEQGKGSSGIPYLSRIPIIGGLFGTQNQSNNREEVLVLITPTVIRDPLEARQMTDEYGERFRGLEPLRKGRPATR
jgi:general secretion pathway protein D